MTISYFSRKKSPGFHSIEGVFAILIQEIKKQYETEIKYLPYKSAHPASLLKNIRFARKQKSKINHVTGDIHYIAPFLGKRTILTIHDIGAAFNGNFIRDLYIKLFWLWLPALFVKYITVISETSANEVTKYIPFAKNKIRVIHNPINAELKFDPKKETHPSKIHILHLGTKTNKNLERVITALSGLDCFLTIIGKLTDYQKELLQQYKIEYTNQFDLPYDAVIKAYQKCDIVSFPSLYEGFGMPIVEAQAIGRPILAGGIDVLHEVAGEGALFVNPHSTEEIKKGFEQLIYNSELRQKLIEAGQKNVTRFNVESIAKQYIELYKKLENQ